MICLYISLKELCNLAAIKIERNSNRIEEAVFSILEVLNGCYEKLNDGSKKLNTPADQIDTSPEKVQLNFYLNIFSYF